MVLICNNNVLTIEKFHKNRCMEKNDMRNIAFDIKYNKEKFKERPVQKSEAPIYISQMNNDKTPCIRPIHSKYKQNV